LPRGLHVAPPYCPMDSTASWRCDITQTNAATLEAQTEHLTVEQTAFYNMLSNNAQREAYLASIPVPSDPEGNMHIRVTYDDKFIGTLTIGKSLAYACDNLEGLLQRDSDALYAGSTTTADVLADYAEKLRFTPVRSMDPPESRLAGHSKQDKRRNANGVNPAAQPTVNLGG